MAEFIEVPIVKEDGSEGLHYVNIEAISYVDSHIEQGGKDRTLTVYLHNGYWFTLSGPKVDEVLHLIKGLMCINFRNSPGDQ
jgi:hypothetical protein